MTDAKLYLVEDNGKYAIRKRQKRLFRKERWVYLYFGTQTGLFFGKDAACYLNGCWTSDKETAVSIFNRLSENVKDVGSTSYAGVV